MAVFFRAVSPAELVDIRVSGALRSGPNSCEGKHLAIYPNDAQRWGTAFFGRGRLAVVRVTVPDDIAAGMFRWEQLDGIGPACFATIQQLSQAKVVEVTDEY